MSQCVHIYKCHSIESICLNFNHILSQQSSTESDQNVSNQQSRYIKATKHIMTLKSYDDGFIQANDSYGFPSMLFMF